MLWVDRRADVAADRDLHVPARVPDVLRRAPARRAPDGSHGAPAPCTTRATVRTAPSHAAHAAQGTATHLHDAPPAMAFALDRAGDRLGRWPATSACRTRSAGTTSIDALARAGVRGRRRPRRAAAVEGAAAATEAEAGAERMRARADADGGVDAHRARRHRHRVFIWLEAPRASPTSVAASSRRVHRLLLNKYYVDEIYDAAVVQPITARLAAGLARRRRRRHRRRGQRRRRRSSAAARAAAAAADRLGARLRRRRCSSASW